MCFRSDDYDNCVERREREREGGRESEIDKQRKREKDRERDRDRGIDKQRKRETEREREGLRSSGLLLVAVIVKASSVV